MTTDTGHICWPGFSSSLRPIIGKLPPPESCPSSQTFTGPSALVLTPETKPRTWSVTTASRARKDILHRACLTDFVKQLLRRWW